MAAASCAPTSSSTVLFCVPEEDQKHPSKSLGRQQVKRVLSSGEPFGWKLKSEILMTIFIDDIADAFLS